MARTKVEKTGTFQAIDSAGTTHTVSIYTTFSEVTFLSEPPQWIEGLKAYKMSNGNHVNANDDGTLEEVRTGRIMRRL
jgi:hypothetical protein